MALIKCKECGNEVSTSAKSCPQCGAKVIKPVGKLGLSIAAFIVIIMFMSIITTNSTTQTPSQTPEQKAATAKQDAAIQRAANGAVLLKKTMRDPDSFKLESALVIDGTGTVCYEYRAKNGFGGTNAEKAVLSGKRFLNNTMDGFVKLWNKECAGKSGQEAVTAINWFAL